MQQRFQQMQTMMNQMTQAKTPAERQKLMAEHRKMMQEQLLQQDGGDLKALLDLLVRQSTSCR